MHARRTTEGKRRFKYWMTACAIGVGVTPAASLDRGTKTPLTVSINKGNLN